MKENQQWSSKLGFILSAAGSAIGLGAIWKFPYIAGVSGGGAFFFIFLLFTILLGLPLLLAEFAIGRSTQSDAIESYKKIAPNSKWYSIGFLGMITCFVLLSFYSVIGGWIILYLVKAISGELNGLNQQQFGELFGATISNPMLSVGAHLVFIIITIAVVAKGVQNGIERTSKFMMPALFLLFIVLIFRSITLEGAMEGVQFLFYPDFSKLTSEAILAALGQSFFTLSVGVSVMLTYSSYLPKDSNLPQSAISIVGMNIFIVIMAGLAIFPGVFTFGLKPDAGPVLLFNVLPTVFNQMAFGMIFFVAFLMLFLFASLTSAFSMLEIIVSVIAKGDANKRIKWSWIIGLTIFAVGVPSALSFGIWSDVSIFGKSIFDAADYLVSNILMPVGALLISIFVPLKMKKSMLYAEISNGSSLSKGIFNTWFFLMRYVAPIAIFLVLLDVLGVWKLLSR
ncbi:sodium-dependent transporter [Peribacillus frigoritolerans]|uniref:sodium-dependent transporter n=1 Tax=Peribacillus frigoritolerans TaxID=450367 RepID=UPI00105A5BDE|nr:sodium-dependent transporter [Peribacillus frigoritolerans]TDL83036.1 sodium-dependent transporter [Peribacillus frigoritolerans]